MRQPYLWKPAQIIVGQKDRKAQIPVDAIGKGPTSFSYLWIYFSQASFIKILTF
jgi:hypothetical protein